MTLADSSIIDPATNVNDEGEIINLFGTTGRRDVEISILHRPKNILSTSYYDIVRHFGPRLNLVLSGHPKQDKKEDNCYKKFKKCFLLLLIRESILILFLFVYLNQASCG